MKMELGKQHIPILAICVSIILSAAIIAYKPQLPRELQEFRFVTGIPPVRGAVTSEVGYVPAVAVGDEWVKTISLSGAGSASAKANQATLTVGVQTEAPYASEAVEENARMMTAVINAIKNLGLSEDEIKTVTYSVHPVYDRDWKQVTDYRVINLVQVRVSNLDLVGDVIDAASDAEANRIDGISFGLSDDLVEELKFEAYREALRDAEAKAEVIAESLGLTLTGVYSVSESVYYPYSPYPAPARTLAMGEAATPIIEGSLSISVTVQVVYTFQ